MIGRILRVDLSEGARDFQPTATEPGLAMLDRNQANYAIMRRWLGDLAAEPEWIEGESVNFYVYDQDRGRLERVECEPATKHDLQKTLKNDLAEIESKFKKAKPASSTEELLHRIARQAFNRNTADLDTSDHDSYFFKYREPGGNWRLVWCWGYQRADQQPSNAIICGNPECNQLFVRRPKTKPRCPGCQQITVKRKGAAAVFNGRTLAALLLLLLLGALAIALFYPPKLVVSPQRWAGPPGSRVEFSVVDQRWFFFESDVTGKVHAQSDDTRVVELGPADNIAKAKALGSATVTFRYADHAADVEVTVGPATPPNSLAVSPDSVKLAVGSTERIQVMGHYDDGPPVDVTELVGWQAADTSVVFAHRGLLEGAAAGNTTIAVQYPAADDETPVQASVAVQVIEVDFESLAIAIEPISVGVGESSKLTVDGVAENGDKYRLLGSSQLRLDLAPSESAKIDDEYVIGKTSGPATLTANFQDLSQPFPFMVIGGSLDADTFVVTPGEVTIAVGEYYQFDVVTGGDGPIEMTSSDTAIVETIGGSEIAGRGVGEATLTVSQGGKQQTVTVTVEEANIQRLRIEPSLISVRVGESESFRVIGVADDGREIFLAGDRIIWVKQPPPHKVALDRSAMRLKGVAPTDKSYELLVNVGEQMAEATVNVVSSPLAISPGEFQVYPPLPVGPTRITTGGILGGDMVFDGDGLVVGGVAADSPLAIAGIPEGAVILGHNGAVFEGAHADDLRRYITGHPFADGDVVLYRTPDGEVLEARLGLTGVAVQEVRLLDTRPFDIEQSNFKAELHLELDRQAEYRITDTEGNELSPWQELGPNAQVKMNSDSLVRSEDDQYELYVERKIGDKVKRFQIPFTLKLQEQ